MDHVRFESLPGVRHGQPVSPRLAGEAPRDPDVDGTLGIGEAAGQLLSTHLARKGFVVLAYDPVGQGDRQQAYDARVGRSLLAKRRAAFYDGPAAILMGQSVARYFIHDGMRAINLVSRPEVDCGAHWRDRLFCGKHTTTEHRRAGQQNQGCRGRVLYELVQDAVLRLDRRFREKRTGFLGWSRPDGLRWLLAPKPWLITSTTDDFFTLLVPGRSSRRRSAGHAPRRRESREMGRRPGRSRHAAESG